MLYYLRLITEPLLRILFPEKNEYVFDDGDGKYQLTSVLVEDLE